MSLKRAAVWALLGMPLLAGPNAYAGERAIIGMQLEPPVLDPTANPAAAISEVLYGNVLEGLVQFAADGSVLPRLAAAWDISDDGLTYVFHLVAGARFHDGSSFDAAAAKYSLDRIIAAGSINPQRSRFGAIRSVEIVDSNTVKIALNRRSGGLLQSLAFGSAVMVSPQSAVGNAIRPIGTGPFRFARWRRGDSITLTRNPDYRGPPAGLEEVTFKFITDPNAAYAALMAGDVDAFANYPAPESFAQFAADPRFAVFAGTTEMEVVLALNERVAPLGNLLVRRAIAYALDRRAIIDGAMFGYGTPIGSHFPPRNPAYVDLTGMYPHDIAKAKELMAAAGYPQGFTMTLKLPPPDDAADQMTSGSAASHLPDIERRPLRALADGQIRGHSRPATRGRLPVHHAKRLGDDPGRLPRRRRVRAAALSRLRTRFRHRCWVCPGRDPALPGPHQLRRGRGGRCTPELRTQGGVSMSTDDGFGVVQTSPAAAGSEEAILAKAGYKPELRRSLRFFSMFAIAFSIISITTGIFLNYGFGLQYWGPASIWDSGRSSVWVT